MFVLYTAVFPLWREDTEHDAHEFLVSVLDFLDMECQRCRC